MEGLSRWLCSFYADKVRIQKNVTPGNTTTCGEPVLLCTVELTNAKSAFKDYHENKVVVAYESIIPATSRDYTVDVKTANCRKLCVYFTARRAGTATVKLDLGKWYLFEDESDEKIQVLVLPSSPERIKVSHVGYVARPSDREYRSEIRTNSPWELFLDKEFELKFHVEDRFGNIIVQVKDKQFFDVTIDSNSYLDHLEWEITNGGTILARFRPKKVGETNVTVQLLDKRSNSEYCFREPVNIIHPPVSPSLTLKFLQEYGDVPKHCTAGKDFIFEMKLYDIFGCPVSHDTTAICDVEVELIAPRKKAREPSEITSTEKITTGNSAAVAVKVAFRIAGDREIKVVVNPGSKKPSHETICVQVLPSTPDALTDVRFIPESLTFDDSFRPDSSVVYCNQWSFLEASLVDAYNNVIHSCEEYDISLELSDGTDIAMKYLKEEDLSNVKVEALVKLKEIGSFDLLIKLSDYISDEVYSLKEVELRVVDAPFSLVWSEFSFPDTLTAGEEAELEIHRFDVFGCPCPINSSSNCNLDAEIVNDLYAFAEVDGPEKTIEFKTERTESNVRCYFSIVLTKAGVRRLQILNKDTDDTKMLNIRVNPDLTNTHWELVYRPGEPIYRREKLEYTVGLFDRFDNEVPRQTSMENIPYLVKLTGPDDGMQCTGKLFEVDEDNEVALTCHFTKSGSYSIRLAQRHGDDTLATFSISVQDAPLDSYYSSVEWSPKYKDIPKQPVFQDDDSFQCCLKLKDVVDCDFDEKIDNRSVKVKYDKTEVKDVKVSSSAKIIGRYTVVVPLKDVLKVHDPNPKFWFFVNGIQLAEALVFPRYENFQKYNDGKCLVASSSLIYCYDVKRSEIIGEDYMYLNNIKRVCKLQEDPKVQEFLKEYYIYADDDHDSNKGYTVIELPEEGNVHECRNVLLHLLRATHYRNQAFQADKCREEWKEMANEYYEKYKRGENVDSSSPPFCSQIKEKYAKLMESYHNAACEEFFKFFNAGRGQSEIDLHGLLVVDEEKLQDYERQLLLKGQMSYVEIRQKIKEERDRGNEAVRKLRERLTIYDVNLAKKREEPWLEIIVGAGNHSKGRQRIRPKIEECLKNRRLPYSPVNKGALVVTIQKYCGPQPCFGEYYCSKCGKIWKSSRSWVDQWQACYKCHKSKAIIVKCFPLKQRPKRNFLDYRPVSKRQTEPIPHLRKLCGKCIELGRECPQPQRGVYRR